MLVISQEEKLMYRVMKAIFDSGIPLSFKGSMVLKACLWEAGYNEDVRHTVDIDANWSTVTPPTTEAMVTSLQKALDDAQIPLSVSSSRIYGEKRSAGFDLRDSSNGTLLFTMDIDVNRPSVPTQIYEIEGIRFCGVTPLQMIAEKISAISTNAIFRRVKDLVDIYYLSHIFSFDKDAVITTMQKSNRTPGDFEALLLHQEELRNAYEKYRLSGNVPKPAFEMIYQKVISYIHLLLPAPGNTYSTITLPIHLFCRFDPISRSEAKHLCCGTEAFHEVILDFDGIPWMGQGFAHQIFIVYQREHPTLKITPVNMCPGVEQMYWHVIKTAQ